MSPWLSVWGLFADMVGVAIITYDVWPEYRLHQLREAVDWQHKVLASSLAEKRRDSGVEQVVQEMLHDMGCVQMNRLRNGIGLPPITEGRRLPTDEEIHNSQTETGVVIANKLELLVSRTRPPLGLGVILVLLGFLLQLLGALPPAFVQANFG